MLFARDAESAVSFAPRAARSVRTGTSGRREAGGPAAPAACAPHGAAAPQMRRAARRAEAARRADGASRELQVALADQLGRLRYVLRAARLTRPPKLHLQVSAFCCLSSE